MRWPLRKTSFVLAGFLILAAVAEAAPLGTSFTYQGQLKFGAIAVNGPVDFQFTLWDSASGGSQVGLTQTKSNVNVENGLFALELDFGADAFPSESRWIGVSVRYPTGSGVYTPMSTRVHLTAVPYALALPALWPQLNATSPNLVGGWDQNFISDGVVGATLSGGGSPLISGNPRPNRISDNYGAIGGGSGNLVGNLDTDVNNANHGTIGGGYANEVRASVSTVGGGWYNRATGDRATIAGGWNNLASARAATVGGGRDSQATGTASTVPGGHGNRAVGDYSLAAGLLARANHKGAFVWADSANLAFESSGVDQFLVRAAGGMGIGTDTPTSQLTVAGTIESTSGGIKFPDGTVQGTAAIGSGNSLWSANGSNVYYNAGNVGIGTNEPAAKLNVEGNIQVDDGRHKVLIGDVGDAGHGMSLSLFWPGIFPDPPKIGKADFVYDGDAIRLYAAGGPVIPDETDGITILNEGNVGIGTGSPETTLHVAGGNWDLSTTEGDFKIGTAAHRLKIGIALSGGGAGDVRIRAHGGTNRLILGSGSNNVLAIRDRHLGVGLLTPENVLDVQGVGTNAGGNVVSEVVARFKCTATSHSAVAIDARSGQDSILYFAENNVAHWDIRHDADNADSLNIRYHGGTADNTSMVRFLPDGTTRVRVLEIVGGADLAEPFKVSESNGEGITPGTVVAINPDRPGELKVSNQPYDRKVAGIISGARGLNPGMIMKAADSELANGDHPVALTGRVWCRCDASIHAVKPGDLLTTSTLPGHAMKVIDYTRAQGAILGKAMTALDGKQGLVLVLVTLQ